MFKKSMLIVAIVLSLSPDASDGKNIEDMPREKNEFNDRLNTTRARESWHPYWDSSVFTNGDQFTLAKANRDEYYQQRQQGQRVQTSQTFVKKVTCNNGRCEFYQENASGVFKLYMQHIIEQ